MGRSGEHMGRVRPRSLRKKTYRARSAEDRCAICGNLRDGGRCTNRYCTEFRKQFEEATV
jgi:hypothetical protein